MGYPCPSLNSDLLTINGHGIPIKHWGWFHKKCLGAKEFAWEKFVVSERERYETEDLFWAKHSDQEGNRLRFQKILNILKRGCQTDGRKDATDTLWFFNGDLTHPDARGYFHYRRGSNVMVCTKGRSLVQSGGSSSVSMRTSRSDGRLHALLARPPHSPGSTIPRSLRMTQICHLHPELDLQAELE
ncbi:hypothetical protein K466DRAFT_606628 [Polyporus arcularius HHB13444]|uniref:Uncharacterized protein n=1 Tax=Polyporus arcularius HHB13444 TaxID=1314778 RepID=A0A5C3NNL0_9APHY|nr:hypothetical protein K466DRAFT_606628 [Polyporus arcularius HHB13444]